jgi:hypothetical protein
MAITDWSNRHGQIAGSSAVLTSAECRAQAEAMLAQADVTPGIAGASLPRLRLGYCLRTN